MAAKRILFAAEGRVRLLEGANALAGAVETTLGPGGRLVLLERPFQSSPLITKDGVTVADQIEVEDRFANMAVEMIKEVAARTSRVAGDGTTTATVLARAIYRAGARMVAAGHHPVAIKRGIEGAVAEVVAALHRMARPVADTDTGAGAGAKDIVQIATISANGDRRTGEIIAEAMAKVGTEGVITIEQGSGLETTLEVAEGTEVERGYLSGYFVTDDERMVVELDDPLILIHEEKISRMHEIVPVLELVSRAGRSLLIVGDVEGEALTTLVVNKLRGALKICAIKPPSYAERRRELLGDLAAQTGARAITWDLGLRLESVTLEDLGHARRVTVDQERTTIVGGASRTGEIAARAADIRAQVEATSSTFDHQQLRERLAKLIGGVGVIRVGAATEAEMREKQALIENALNATRAAIAEGIVPGGGVALLRAAAAIGRGARPSSDGASDEAAGAAIVRQACEEPCRRIAHNAGRDGDSAVILQRIREGKGAYGYNAARDRLEDLVDAGVIDPVKVVRSALQNAASVATLLIMTEALIVDAPREPTSFPTSGGTAQDALSVDPFLSRR